MGEIGPSEYVRVLPEAYDNTEWHAIVAVGDHPDLAELPSPTPNTTWVRFVPGRAMMQCSKALIFHGGQNTAMASLIHKLPSLIFPGQDFERDFNARALASIGAGLHMQVEDFTPERLLDATREIQGLSYALATETYSWKVQRQGGPQVRGRPDYTECLAPRVSPYRYVDLRPWLHIVGGPQVTKPVTKLGAGPEPWHSACHRRIIFCRGGPVCPPKSGQTRGSAPTRMGFFRHRTGLDGGTIGNAKAILRRSLTCPGRSATRGISY